MAPAKAVAADRARRPTQPAKVAEVAARAVVAPAAVVGAQFRVCRVRECVCLVA